MPPWRTVARAKCHLVAALVATLSPATSQAQRPPDSTLDARVEVQRRAPSTILDLIGARIAGVAVTRAGGAVGAGGRLRIRGASSLLLGTEPLIVVDGIRVDGTPADRSSAFSSHLPSRINDFEVDEIESITVLRGPAAAAIYGSDGANGVIELVTRRPTGGPTRFAARINAGTTWFADPEGRFPSNYYLGRDNRIHEFNVLAFNRARGYPDVFSNGFPANAMATVDGAVGRIDYHLSGSARRETSYLDYDWQHRYGTRLNLRYRTPSGNLTVHLNAGIRASRLRGGSAPQPILTGITFACNFPGCEPAAGDDSATTGWNGPRHGYQFYAPEDFDLVNARDRVTRTTGSLALEHRLGSWFRHRLVIGPDLVRNRSSLRIEPDPSGGNPFFASQGTETQLVNDATSWSVDYLPEFSWTAGGARATTTVGAHYRSRSRDYRELFRTFDGLTSAREEHREGNVRSVLLHQRLRWRDRLELRAGIRGDQPGYGDVRGDWAVSPNLGASWNVAGGSKSQLTVNAAWGRIDRADQTLSFLPGPVFGSPGPAEKPSPERVNEWEIGLAASRGDRISATIGWYDRRIPNLLAILPNRPSGTGGGLVNHGRLTSRGLELTVDAVPLRRARSRLDLELAFATNDQTLDDLALVGVLGQLGPGQYQVNGFAPGSYFFRRIVSATVGPRTTLPNGSTLPTATDLMCQGGTHLSRGNGTTVPCDGAPLLYAGRPSPAWYGSLTTTFSHRGWWVSALLDGMDGHSALVGEIAGLHSYFLNSRAALEGTDPILTGYRSDLDAGYLRPGLLRAGFVKVRTLAFGMTLPAAVAGKLGARHGSVAVFGDNLLTLWRSQAKGFGVPWLDPETVRNGYADITGVSGFAQDGFPLPARLRVGVQLEY